MQDRFKLRIWDYNKSVMVYFDSPWACKKPYTEGSTFPQYENSPHYHKISDFMQCTGLKDNNSKMIFEGDIVKFSSIYGHGVFEIKWSDELATFGYEDKDTDFCELGRLYQEAAYVEILGNIYENTETLKEAQ